MRLTAQGHPAVLIMTPSRGRSMDTLYTAGILSSSGAYGGWLPMNEQSDIYVARNVLANEFMHQRQFDTLVFIDSDVGFTKPDLQQLLAHPGHLVAGCYPGRHQEIVNLCKAGGARPTIEEVRARGDKAVIDLGPMGFTKIDRIVFDTIIAKGLAPSYGKGRNHHFFQSGILDDELASEDFMFFDLAKRAGFQAFAEGRLNLNHGGYTFPIWERK